MKRRDFLIQSAGVALLGTAPLSLVASPRGDLLDDPSAWVGTRFRTDDGTTLELSGVTELNIDPRSRQCRLQFRAVTGPAPTDGLHRLIAADCEQTLFLQSGGHGPVACLNLLRTTA